VDLVINNLTKSSIAHSLIRGRHGSLERVDNRVKARVQCRGFLNVCIVITCRVHWGLVGIIYVVR
jgi:hypothetical protein